MSTTYQQPPGATVIDINSNVPYILLDQLNSRDGDDVALRHPLYARHAAQVKLVNDVYNGVDSCRRYIFKFPQEIKDTYDTRCERATLRNFVKRATDAFIGMIFRKPMQVDGYPARTTRLFKAIDTVNTIQDFVTNITEMTLRDGKGYILIDAPAEDAPEAIDRPYMLPIERSQVINWRKDALGLFTMVVIEEIITVPFGKFGSRYIRQWRHYQEDGTITIYRDNRQDQGNNRSVESGKAAGQYVYKQMRSEYRGIPLVEIDLDDTPPLYDVAQMNIKHFNRQSHKDRYLTMAALPIPIIWGAEIDDENKVPGAKPALIIGVDEAFVFNGPKDEADFQWRELSGDSVELLEKDLNSITEDITTGILRAAETVNAVQKTATEVALLQAEASNRVSALANAVNVAMRKALRVFAEFNQETAPEDALFELSSDFNAALAGTDGQRLIFEAYMAGTISIETFLESMAEAELITIDSAKEELERIKADKFKPEPRIKEEKPAQAQAFGKPKDNRTKGAMSGNY